MFILVVLLLVLMLGVAVVAYGTAVKNKWGINPNPICCPRCKTCLPMVREPQSLREAMWGGCICPVCGAGVDKWGRQVAPPARPTKFRTQREIRSDLRKRLIIITAIVNFCLTIFSYWSGFGESERWIPSGWKEALDQIALALLVASFWTVLFSLVGGYALEHFLFNDRSRSGTQGHESEPMG